MIEVEVDVVHLRSEVATWSLDLASRRVMRSSNHELFYGYPENLPHWNIEHFLDHVHGDDVELFLTRMQDLMRQHENFDFKFRVIWKDGSVHTLRSTGCAIVKDDGKTSHVVGSTWLV